MAGFSYLINISVNGGNALDRAISAANRLGGSLDHVQVEADQAGTAMDRAGRRGASAFEAARSSLSGWLAGLGIAAATLGSLQANAQASGIENAIRFAGGVEGAANLEFVRQEVDALKLPLMESMDGFKTLSGSVMGTGITTQQTKDIFHSTAEAATVMGLSADNTSGALLALGQMASKGKVQAEELRGQLGERIPGAFNIAARAMGVSTAQLDKMMERGEVAAKDFLPRFAAEMHRTFGPGVAGALDGPQQQFNMFNNSLLELKRLFAEEIMPVVTDFINLFIGSVKWVKEHRLELEFLGVAIGGVVLVSKTWAVWQAINTAWGYAAAYASIFFQGALGRQMVMEELATIVTGGFTTAMTALNAAFWANPVGFVIAGLLALGAVVVYAWNKFEGFRASIYGVWEWIKELGRMVGDYLARRFMGLAHIIQGVFTLDWDKTKQGFSEVWNATDAFEGGGKRLGQAFDKGWNSGVAEFQADKSGVVSVFNPQADGLAMNVAMPGGKNPMANDIFNGKQQPPYQPDGGGKGYKAKSGLSGMGSAGGGRNVTINNKNLVENIVLHVANMKEGADEIKTIVIRALQEVLNSGNQAQTAAG